MLQERSNSTQTSAGRFYQTQMKTASPMANKRQSNPNEWPLKKRAGMTLLEVAIASFLFTVMAVSILTAMVQTRKIAENNVAQTAATVVAQGIIEQVQLTGYDPLITDASVPVNYTAPDSNNYSGMQQIPLLWAPDATTFYELGAHSDPADLTSPVLGILLDMAYKNGSTVIRPARYMKMKANLQRNIHTADDNIEITLTYSWLPPSGNGQTSSRWITREIRTIRSQAPSY
jgi:type II secretory pathway pseudopilin PulG